MLSGRKDIATLRNLDPLLKRGLEQPDVQGEQTVGVVSPLVQKSPIRELPYKYRGDKNATYPAQSLVAATKKAKGQPQPAIANPTDVPINMDISKHVMINQDS